MDRWMDGWVFGLDGWVRIFGFPNGAVRAALEETRRNVSPTVGRVARR